MIATEPRPIAAATLAIEAEARRNADRLEERDRLRHLLDRSDALLTESLEANYEDRSLRPAFRLDLLRLVRDVAPAWLTPQPHALCGPHVRIGLAVRGWTPEQLGTAAKLAPSTIEKAAASGPLSLVQRNRICAALGRAVEVVAAANHSPMSAQIGVDAVFEVQEVLFAIVRRARGVVILSDEEEV